MLINHSRIAIATAALAALLTGALFVRSWLDARDARTRLAATLDAQRQVIAAADARELQRATELRSALDQIAALKRSVQTPQQAVAALPQILPSLPLPISIALPKPGTSPGSSGAAQSAGAGNSPAATGPPAASATIPQADLKPLYDYIQDCRACQLQLSATRADLTDERAKSQALVRERDAAVKAAKGGPFWSRVKRGAKWFAIGLAVGAAASAAARHH